MTFTRVTSKPGRGKKPRRIPTPKPPGAARAVSRAAATSGTSGVRRRALVPWTTPEELTYYVHAHGPTVRANKETGLNHSLVLVRRSDRLGEMVIARHIELPGSSRLVHRHSQPLPETENNAVAVLETTEPPVLYFDPPGPTTLASDVPLSSCVRVLLTDEEWRRRAQRATHRITR